jgi:phenylacetate-CoA ligase
MEQIDLLRAPRETIDAAQARNFAEMIALAAERHPRTRAALGGAKPPALAGLARLPVTRKADYMSDPASFLLDTRGLSEVEQAVWDTMYTTGSTAGVPTPFVSTTYDFFRILEANRSMLRLRGARPEDIIANLFPLTPRPHGAFIRVLHAAASMNLRVVSALPGNPSPEFTLGNELDGVVDVVARSRATILWGVPSYLRKVLERAEERRADLSAVRLAFVTGEGVGEAARDSLTAALRRLGRPDAWVSISYGATELQGGLVECAPGSGYHNPAPDQFHFEIVEPSTLRPLGEGEQGLVLLTHLRRRGTVLLRYALGDISALTRARCPQCGSWTDRLTVMPRRADALLKIKGTLVNPEVLVQAAEAVLGAGDFQFVVQDGEVLGLFVAGPHNQATSQTLAERVKQACGVTPLVRFGEIAVEGWKLKRVVDQRRPM